MKRIMLVLSALAVFGFVFGGCKKETPAEPPPPAADENKADEPPPPPPPPADEEKKDEPAADEATGDEAAAGDNKVGVPECDEYIEKYGKCLMEKAPEASKAAMKQAFDTAVEGWKKAAAASPEAKAALANGCKMALDAAKKASAAWGCEW